MSRSRSRSRKGRRDKPSEAAPRNALTFLGAPESTRRRPRSHGQCDRSKQVLSADSDGSSVSECSRTGYGWRAVTRDGKAEDDDDEEEDDEDDYSSYESSSDEDLIVAKPKASKAKRDEVEHFVWSEGMLLNSRYSVTKLLGDGTFGRVLLVMDSRKSRQFAIKIIRNVEKYTRNAKREAEILKDIHEADPKAAAGCVRMYETFWHQAAEDEDTRFFCLVFEVLGPSLLDILKRNRYRGFWAQDIQSIAHQCLSALRFLHEDLNLTHTDLKLENVLFVSTQEPQPSCFPREAAWLKGRKGSRNVATYVRPPNARIKLIDFGNATYDLEHHSSVINTRQYRAPEVILALGWNERSDLWSMGCILMEIYSGELLFRTHESIEHLALMERTVEPIPSSMLNNAGSVPKDSYLVEDQTDSNWHLNWPMDSATESSRRHVAEQQTLAQMVQHEHRSLADFAASLLIVDPAKRPASSVALAHPFLFEQFLD